MSSYEFTPRLYIEPFEIHPLEEWILWYRPVADGYDFTQNFDVNFYTGTYWECCKIYLTKEEHTKLAKRSLVDYVVANGDYDLLPREESHWAYNPAYVYEYEDTFWQMYVIDRFFPDFASSGYYSEIELYNYWFRGAWSF